MTDDSHATKPTKTQGGWGSDQPTAPASLSKRSALDDVPLPSSSSWGRSGSGAPPPPPPTKAGGSKSKNQNQKPKITAYGASRFLFIAGLISVIMLVCACAIGIVGYVTIAGTLPSPTELAKRATELFTSSQIYDRNGNLLYELVDPQGGRRTTETLNKISPWLIKATIDTEDPRFYSHPGFDPIGIIRAVFQNVRSGTETSGASTIAQQLVRNLLLPEGAERTLNRKIREAILAAEITRQYPRDTILELYLNSINYGNLAYGIQAAAQTYFHKDAAALTLAEASFLAGIPQAPAVYDPYTTDGLKYTLNRQKDVLRLMQQAGDITADEAKIASEAMQTFVFTPPSNTFATSAPHWVVYVKQLVEAEFGPEALYRGGLKIYTTLDPKLQSIAEQVVDDQIAQLGDKHVTDAGLIAMDPRTGEILAMVGSPDFNNVAISGQVNMTLRPRQTGSVIKPITYLAAFEKGWTPSTVLWDVPVVYTDTAGNIYAPNNYDDRFHGPQWVRSTLANSYNIPAVKTLVNVGIPQFLDVARRLGIDTLTRPDYGPALTLGGGEVPLIEMTGAIAVLANQGVYMPPIALDRVEKADGSIVCQFTPSGQDNQGVPLCQPIENTGAQLVKPQQAYLLTNILADNAARTPAFGPNSALVLSRPAAVKTGTTNDFKDNWTIGYTPDLIAGIWVGNADNTPMEHISGVTGAGPIWHNFMEQALADRPVLDFARPAGIVEMEVCADSGAQPSQYCPSKKKEIYFADQLPAGPDHDWYQMLNCDGNQQVMLVVPDEAREWINQNPDWLASKGVPLAPPGNCAPGQPIGSATVNITSPTDGSTVNGIISIVGTVTLDNFDHYQFEQGVSWNPGGWEWVSGPYEAQVTNGELGQWDTRSVADGQHTLRLTAFGKGGGHTEFLLHVIVQNNGPTPTPTDTPPPTGTPGPTLTDTPLPLPTLPPSTSTPTPTDTSIPPTLTATSPAPTDTPIVITLPPLLPTDTPTPTITPTLTLTPTLAAIPVATIALP
jgi:penicillin-binding protein 1C